MIDLEFKDKLKKEFCEITNRNPNKNEEGNLENEYSLIVRVLIKEIIDLKNRINKLELK